MVRLLQVLDGVLKMKHSFNHMLAILACQGGISRGMMEKQATFCTKEKGGA
jgi:hypothetical protein